MLRSVGMNLFLFFPLLSASSSGNGFIYEYSKSMVGELALKVKVEVAIVRFPLGLHGMPSS